MVYSKEIEYSTDVTNLKQTKYRRYWTAVTVAWAIFVICAAVMNAVSFIQPQWIGDTEKSPGIGFFGLYERCEQLPGGDKSCRGDFMNFKTILSNSFKAASVLVGVSNLCMLFCVLSLLLFFFLTPAKVFRIAAWLQLISCACIVAAVVVYPNGWGAKEVMKVCGNEGKYDIGKCHVRWAYILSIVLFFNGLALAVLAFMLANKQADLMQRGKEKEDKNEDLYSDVRDDIGVVPFTVNDGFSTPSSQQKEPLDSSQDGGSFVKAEIPQDEVLEVNEVPIPDDDDIRL